MATFLQRIVAGFPVLEPWYNWGILYCDTMADETPYERRFFDLERFGIGFSIQVGRYRKEPR